jgi:2',3'-cyclic-nucleotide 2'-phosphodiesterase
MRILFIGDVVGEPGRNALKRWLPELREELTVDIVIANGENAAGGVGATPEVLREMERAGVDAFTLGNHTWRKRELAQHIDELTNVARPANFAPGIPGTGAICVKVGEGRQVGIVNVQGRVFMEPTACPFRAAEDALDQLREATPILLVDMHAEATAEKIAMGWYLDGHCTAVVGTHTHVQTVDERVLPDGTAYITDVGMTGPEDSIIGVERDAAIGKFITGMPRPFHVAKTRAFLNGVIIDADDSSGRARSIERVVRTVDAA